MTVITEPSPTSAVAHPVALLPDTEEQLHALIETSRRVVEERDRALERADAEWARAERAESLCVALQSRDLERGVALRDLARRLAVTEAALRAATAPVEPPVGSDAPAPLPQLPEAPARPVRRPPWRRRPRRRH